MRKRSPYTDNDHEIDDVRALHEKFGLPIKEKVEVDWEIAESRYEFIKEEFNELHHALIKMDIKEFADALIDIVYVAKGSAIMLGLPWEELWNDVQRANMEKVKTEDKDHHKGVSKPEGWLPPRTGFLLMMNGWDGEK